MELADERDHVRPPAGGRLVADHAEIGEGAARDWRRIGRRMADEVEHQAIARVEHRLGRGAEGIRESVRRRSGPEEQHCEEEAQAPNPNPPAHRDFEPRFIFFVPHIEGGH